jgi:hypothetical protein
MKAATLSHIANWIVTLATLGGTIFTGLMWRDQHAKVNHLRDDFQNKINADWNHATTMP